MDHVFQKCLETMNVEEVSIHLDFRGVTYVHCMLIRIVSMVAH